MSNSQDGFQWNNLDEDDTEESADSEPEPDTPEPEGSDQPTDADTEASDSMFSEDGTDAEGMSTEADARIDKLEEKLAEKNVEIDQLNDTIASQKTEIESLKATISSLRKKNESLETSIDKLNTAQDNAEAEMQPQEAPESVQDDLLAVLDMLEDEVDGAVPYSRLIATAKNSGLPEDALDPALNTLMRKGEVVEPFSKQYETYTRQY